MDEYTQAAILGIGGLVMVNVGLLGLVMIAVRAARRTKGQGAPKWAPDPAFADEALAEDAQWAGIEEEWLEFIDALPETSR
jgi:hypothetical protein